MWKCLPNWVNGSAPSHVMSIGERYVDFSIFLWSEVVWVMWQWLWGESISSTTMESWSSERAPELPTQNQLFWANSLDSSWSRYLYGTYEKNGWSPTRLFRSRLHWLRGIDLESSTWKHWTWTVCTWESFFGVLVVHVNHVHITMAAKTSSYALLIKGIRPSLRVIGL